MKTQLQKAFIAVVAVLLSFASFAQNSRNAASSNKLNFDYYQSLIYIKVKVEDKPNLVFLVNTGANSSVIDSKTAKLLKLKLTDGGVVTGNAGQEKLRMAKVDRMQIGKNVLTNLSLTSRSLSAWQLPNGKTIDGIIGTDILSNYVVTINYKNKNLLFAKKTSAPMRKYEYNIPFQLEDGMVKLTAMLDDTFQTQLSFNSGSSIENTGRVYVNVSPLLWRNMQLTERYPTPVQYVSGNAVGGYQHLPVVKISKMEFEKFKITQPFMVIQSKEGYYAKDDAIGFFGNNLLEKCEVICLNFRDNTISFNNPKPKLAKVSAKQPTIAKNNAKAQIVAKAPVKVAATKMAKE